VADVDFDMNTSLVGLLLSLIFLFSFMGVSAVCDVSASNVICSYALEASGVICFCRTVHNGGTVWVPMNGSQCHGKNDSSYISRFT